MPSPRYWREIPARFRLEAVRCKGCGKVVYPARRVCPACRGTDLEPTRLSRSGKVVTSTVIHVAPAEFTMETPYAVAVVETPEGARLMVQVVDVEPSEVRPGLPVSLEFRLVRQEGHGGILCYGHKAVPEA
jgi:scaffold protein (connect acetoacetyl-CoA thiolase and HMG-CoA synthase)